MSTAGALRAHLDRRRLAIWGAAAVGVGVAAYAAYGPGGEIGTLLFGLAAAVTIGLAALASVVALVKDATSALAASVLALVVGAVGLHWTGVPVVLGVLGALGGQEARAGDRRGLATTAVVVGMAAVLLALVGAAFLEPLAG